MIFLLANAVKPRKMIITMSKKSKLFSPFFSLIFLFIGLCLAQPALAVEDPPENAFVGVYLNQIYDVSMKDNRLSVDFYIWFRWKNPEFKPHKSFEIVNGQIESRKTVYQDVIEGYQYAVVRVNANLIKFWDVKRFPLDDHVLTIEIEDSENEDFKLTYLADTKNSALSPDLNVPGWKVDRGWSEIVPYVYKTNYGDITLPSDSQSTYSRFIYSVDIIRPDMGYFWKLFLSSFIITLIAFLAFLIRPIDLDPRFGLGVGSLFAAVAAQYVVTSSLPDTNVMTLADQLQLVSIVFIFMSLVQSTVSLMYFEKDDIKTSERLDRLSLVAFTAAYLLCVTFLLYKSF